MQAYKFLESKLFTISYITEPDITFRAMKTFNKDKLYQVIDVEFSVPEITFSDMRLLKVMTDHFPIRVLDKEKDKYVFNVTVGKNIHYFIIENASTLSLVIIAIGHCYSFLMQNKIASDALFSKSITQIATDMDNNIIAFLDDDFFGKDEPETLKEQEIKIPMLMCSGDKNVLN